MAGWTMVGFYVNEMTAESIFGGMKSFIWSYSNGRRQVLLSFDGPYHEWHDLALCYSGAGWEISDRRVMPLATTSRPFESAELDLEQPPFNHAHVIFACADSDMECVKPPSYFGEAAVHFMYRIRKGLSETENYDGGVIQIQLLDQTPVELSREQLGANRELFEAAVAYVVGKEGG